MIPWGFRHTTQKAWNGRYPVLATESNYSTVWMLSWFEVQISEHNLVGSLSQCLLSRSLPSWFHIQIWFISNPHTLSHFTVMTPLGAKPNPPEQMRNGEAYGKRGGDDCDVSEREKTDKILFWVESGSPFYPFNHHFLKDLTPIQLQPRGGEPRSLHTTPRSSQWTAEWRTAKGRYRAKKPRIK